VQQQRQVVSTGTLLPLSRLGLLLQGSIPDCPPCPTSPWVVLAKVSFDQSGVIRSIDNCECRRLVISFANFWWTCSEPCHTKETEASPAPERPDIPAAPAAPLQEVGSEDAKKRVQKLIGSKGRRRQKRRKRTP
jgi:hypothetical protein